MATWKKTKDFLWKLEKDDFEITYTCASGPGSAGAPILDYYSNKVIGIHTYKDDWKNLEYGTFLRYPLDELNKKNWFHYFQK